MTKLGTSMYNITINGAKFFVKHPWVYYTLVFTWGIIMTLIGLIVSCVFMIAGYEPEQFYLTWYFEVGKGGWGGISLGLPFVVDTYPTTYTRYHEMGHSVQNAIFGPLHIFIVCLPSLFRYWYREFKYNKKNKFPPTKYDDIWFEGSASESGKIIKEYLDNKNKEKEEE